MHTPALDYIRLTYRSDLHVLFLRWTRSVTSAEHRDGYRTALALASMEQAGRWLIDLRTRGLASAEDFQWILGDFRGQMAAALPGIDCRLAYFVTPYHATLIQERLHNVPASRLAATATLAPIQTFTEEQFAQQWLAGGYS